jgi:hypothetical protein
MAPLLTASAAVVSLLFIVVLAGDLLLPGVGGLASAPAPLERRQAAPKVALEAAPTDADAAGLSSPSPAPEEVAELGEQPEMAMEEEEAVAEATGIAEAPPKAEGTPSAMEAARPTKEDAAVAVPTVAPTMTPVTVLTSTIPREAPVVSEDELGVVDPTPSELEATPRLIQEAPETERPGLSSLLWRVVEIALGLVSLVLILATVKAWRLRRR